MGQIEELKKITVYELIFSILFISGSICPGIATIWFFSPEFLKDCGSLLVILLSCSITLPIVSLNVLNMVLAFEVELGEQGLFFLPQNKRSNAATTLVGQASIVTMFIIGFPLLISFLASLSLYTFSWIVLALQIFFFLAEGILFRWFARLEKEDRQKALKSVSQPT